MPGYNHYPWCLCGWCYKTGAGGYALGWRRKELVEHFREFSSWRMLDKQGATRSWSACFVSSNASCPECGAQVYYYENSFGSRVFFDALGWPWPKHPCTDRRVVGMAKIRNPPPSPLKVRTLGEVKEIAQAALSLGFDPMAEFRQQYGNSPWDLFRIKHAVQTGFRHRITGKPVSPPQEGKIVVEFDSASLVPEVDNFFSLDGNELSIFDFAKSRGHKFRVKIFCNTLQEAQDEEGEDN